MNKLLVAALLSCVAYGGCTGTETGNPVAELQIAYDARSSNADAIRIRDDGAPLRLDDIWLRLGEFSFGSTEAECSDDDLRAVMRPGIGVGNHGGDEPLVQDLSVPSDSYCEVLFDYASQPNPDEPADLPDELNGSAVFLTGELRDGTPVRLLLPSASGVRFAPSDRRFADGLQTLIIAFDVAAWFDGIDIESASREGNEVLISERSNPALLQAFQANLARGTELYRDEDANNRVSGGDTRIAVGSTR